MSKLMLPDVGHYPPFEVPERFAQIIAAKDRGRRRRRGAQMPAHFQPHGLAASLAASLAVPGGRALPAPAAFRAASVSRPLRRMRDRRGRDRLEAVLRRAVAGR
ncbi:MAG: hypothetical protein U1F11_02730 [Steroidobacteraceae bacterium]